MWAAVSDAAGCLDAACERHIKIHDHHIRLQLEAERDRLASIGRLADYIEGRCSQCRFETVTIKGVIIGDHYA
jgi:hypothetical protein